MPGLHKKLARTFAGSVPEPLLESAGMSRTERLPPRAERIRVLLDAGDHAAARAEARAVLADPGAPDRERAAAGDALASLAPDRGVAAAGAIGAAVAIAIAAGLLLRG
jgi:hypothetical protein